MKGFRKILLIFLSVISCICFSFGLSACGANTNSEEAKDENILAIYNMYVAYAEENNTTPLSYSDWLLTIKGEKGDTGEKGEQGSAGINGTNGTNGIDGQDGKSA